MQPHEIQMIVKFPDKLVDKEQCQKFLGCLNYVRSYIPRLSQKTKAIR